MIYINQKLSIKKLKIVLIHKYENAIKIEIIQLFLFHKKELVSNSSELVLK